MGPDIVIVRTCRDLIGEEAPNEPGRPGTSPRAWRGRRTAEAVKQEFLQGRFIDPLFFEVSKKPEYSARAKDALISSLGQTQFPRQVHLPPFLAREASN